MSDSLPPATAAPPAAVLPSSGAAATGVQTLQQPSSRTVQGAAPAAASLPTLHPDVVSGPLQPLPSISSVHPVDGSLRFEATAAVAQADFAISSGSAAPADSAKSLAALPPSQGSQAHLEAATATNGRDKREKHSNSSNSAPIDEPSTNNSFSTTSRDQPSNIQLHPTTPSHLPSMAGQQHLVTNSSDAAGQALAASLAQSGPSLSLVPGLLSTPRTSLDSVDSGAHHLHEHDSNMGQQSSAAATASAAPKRVSTPDRLADQLRQQFQLYSSPAAGDSNALSSAAAAALSSSAVAISMDTVCHCLVLDESLVVDLTEKATLEAALAFTDWDKLRLHIQQWLPALRMEDIVIVYTKHRRVHINFVGYEAIGRALVAYPFLVRCGTQAALPARGGMDWTPANRLDRCGLVRHQLPELLQFSFVPTHEKNHSLLEADVKKLLAEEMHLAYTALWFPYANSQPSRGQRGQSARLLFCVLPRHFSSLAADVQRLHQGFKLWGGTVRVQALNQPQLCRCSQCDQLGHNQDACPKYTGLAIRLLFKQAVSFAALQQMQRLADARLAYLGSSAEEVAPSRRVTLMFDMPKLDKADSVRYAAAQDDIAQRIGRLLPSIKVQLAMEPAPVNPRFRHRECRECGSMDKPHQCRFAPAGAVNRALLSASLNGITQAGGVGAAAPMRGSPTWVAEINGLGNRQQHSGAAVQRAALADSSDDNMCRSWKRNKQCERHTSGLCKFTHPPDYTPPQKVCFSFRDSGYCLRGSTCPFSHGERPAAAPSVAPPAAAVAPAVAAAPGPSVVDAATVVAAPTHAATSATPSSTSRKRRGREEEIKEPAEDQSADHSSTSSTVRGTSTAKKSRSLAAALTLSATSNRYSQLQDGASDEDMQHMSEEEEEEEEHEEKGHDAPPSPPPRPRAAAPISSLSSIASPSKAVTTGKPHARTSNSGAAASTSTATASRSSSTSSSAPSRSSSKK